MSISIRFDNNNMPIEPTLVLMTRSAKKLGAINAHNLNATDNLKGCSEFFFSVEKCDAENIWDYLVDFKLVWVREWNQVYEIYVEYKESQGFVKNVTAKSLGHAELSQINIYDLNANNETDIEIDDVRTVLYSENDAEHSLLNRIIDEKAPHYSINHVDTWVRNIQRTFEFDDINIIDAFSKIEEEVDCIILIDTSIDGTTGLIKREINVYDLEYYCSGSDCNYRGNFVDTCPICGGTNILPGYGNDTSIFVSADNLSDEINLSVNTDSVKNCFKLEAGDDLMTATVVNCNPNGSQYLWYITDETKADMPSELVGKIEDYDELYETYQSTHSYDLSSATSAYNAVANTYKSIDQSLQTITSPVYGFQNLMVAYYNAIDLRLFVNDKCMPSVTLDAVTKETEIAKLTSSSLSPIAVQSLQNVSTATATSSVEAIAKTFINSIFSVNATASGEISKTTEGGVVTAASWSGTITITSYADESQTATTSNLTLTLTDNQTDYVKQRINKILSSKDDDDKYGIVSLFNKSLSAFETELAKYSLSNLQIISDCCQGCLDVLMSMGAANPNTWYDDDLNDDFDYDDNVSTVTYNGNSSTGGTINYYRSYYKPYYKRYLLIQDEMDVRSGEVADVDAMMNLINEKIDATHEALNFGAYLGDTLWEVFSSYRRDDIFSNDNFISDGLDNAEMFAMAREFINDATKEIYKSATLQHTITATLNNLLVIKEFAPIVDYFQVGNWIRIRIEDDVYKLRLISYTVDFDDLNNINVEFSDITKLIDGLSDIESLLDSASSMATSYDYVRRQSKKGLEGNEQLRHWVEDGLSLTNLKIVSTAEEQDIAFDEHGLLAREYLPLTDTYDDKQLKIINRGLFVTNDNWRTCKAGIGDFLFYDPEESEIVEGYGVIADTIVGNIILGEEVGIYNAEGSVTINEDGMKICADMTNGNTTTDTMFKIQRKVDDDTATLGYKIEDLLYLDTDGDLVVNGTLKVFTDGQSSSSSIVDIASGISSEDVDQKINDANALLQQNISNNYYTKSQSDSLISNATSNINSSIASAISNLEIGGRNYISSSTLRWTENSMFALSTGAATKAIGAIRMTDKISVDSGDGYYLSMYGDNLSGTTMLITEYTSNDTFIRSVTNVQPGAISFSNNCAKIGVSLYNYFNDQYQIIEPTTYSNTYSITPPTGAVGYSPIIIGGKSIVMTQLIPNGNFANDVYVAYQSTYSISNNKLTITSQGTGSSVRVCTNNDSRSSVVKGHIYYYRAKAKSSVNTTVRHGFNSNVSSSINVQANTLTIVDALKTATSSGSYSYNYYFNATSTGQTCEYSNSICIDLTKMFGSGNEPTTVEQVRSMFPADYYEYNTGSILNIGCAKIIIKNSNNTITSTLDIPQDIQDLPAYGCSAGSVYNYIDYAEKKYHQCVGSRSFQSGDDSNSSYVTDGAITYYPLSTEVVTDISSLISDELMYSVEVSSGGSVAFAYDTAESYRLPVKTLSKFSYTRVANATVNRLNSDVSATWLSNGLLKIKLEKGNKATDWSPAPEDTASEISSIGSTSERLISESEERLINDISDVEGRLNNTIMIQNEEISTIQGLIEALNKQSNAISEEIKSQDDNLREYTNQRLSDAMAPYGIWLSTDRDGIRIGNTENGVTSAFYTKITNTEIGFYENENKVAYISDQHLFINNATIQDRLVFGDYNTNHFFFSEDNDHGMVITWVEQ